MSKKSSSLSNMGTVSLLMIFIVLCLVTFAILSLSGTVREYRYSQKLAEQNQNFHEASNSATAILAEIDEVLHDAYRKDPGSYPENALLQLAEMDGLTLDTETAEPTVSYQIPVNDTQVLKVVLTINDTDSGYDGFYRITTWKKSSLSEWTEDDNGMNLFQP